MNAIVRSANVQRSAGRLNPRDHYFRAATAHVISVARPGGHPEDVIRQRWPDDPASTFLVQRAAVSPMTTGNAAALAQTAVADFVSTLPQSAASRLINASLRLELAGRLSVAIPRIGTPMTAAFIGEGAPMPVAQLSLAANNLGPASKLAVSSVYTFEMARSANIESLVRVGLSEATGAALDAALFSTTAASSIRPAGLLNGVSALTATAGGGEAAQVADLSKLVAAITAAGGNADDVVFIAAPAQATAIRLRSPQAPFPVFASNSLAAGTVVAVAASGIVFGFGADPQLDASESAVVHMEDAAPTQLGVSTGGTPATAVAAPTRSAFQTACVVLRAILDCAWTPRGPGLVQYLTGATW